MPFQEPIFIKKRLAREQLLQNHHNHGLREKEFNNNIDTSRSDPPKATFVRNKPEMNSVRFVDPYYHINHI